MVSFSLHVQREPTSGGCRIFREFGGRQHFRRMVPTLYLTNFYETLHGIEKFALRRQERVGPPIDPPLGEPTQLLNMSLW